MTQIVTVSANTAAYAMEALRPLPRLPRSKFVEETVRAQQSADRDPEDLNPLLPVDLMSSATSEMFMNSGDQQPQATIWEAIDAYRQSDV